MFNTINNKSKNCIYHITCKSIHGIDIFKEKSDKIKYFSIIKKYKKKYVFGLYAYYLLKDHGYFLIEYNGSDILKIIKEINDSYSNYYNNKYQRVGTLFEKSIEIRLV